MTWRSDEPPTPIGSTTTLRWRSRFGKSGPPALVGELAAPERPTTACVRSWSVYEHVARGRRDKAGVRLVEGEGFAAAAFRHRTSRAADPSCTPTSSSPSWSTRRRTVAGRLSTPVPCTSGPVPSGTSTKPSSATSSPGDSGWRGARCGAASRTSTASQPRCTRPSRHDEPRSRRVWPSEARSAPRPPKQRPRPPVDRRTRPSTPAACWGRGARRRRPWGSMTRRWPPCSGGSAASSHQRPTAPRPTSSTNCSRARTA